jgi:diketogulonate reductase-like aldo/keto reductase
VHLESKVWPTELGFHPTARAVRSSLQQLGTNYVDLYLLHWPRYSIHKVKILVVVCFEVCSFSLYLYRLLTLF